ncbi:hypothetical protein ACQP3F_31860, partial [Escherichia coli]
GRCLERVRMISESTTAGVNETPVGMRREGAGSPLAQPVQGMGGMQTERRAAFQKTLVEGRP